MLDSLPASFGGRPSASTPNTPSSARERSALLGKPGQGGSVFTFNWSRGQDDKKTESGPGQLSYLSQWSSYGEGLPHLRPSQWRPFIALLVLAGAMFSLAGLFLPLVLIRPQKVFALPRRRTLHTLRRAAHPHPCTRGASFRSSSRWDPCSSLRPLPSYVGRWSS